MKQKTNSDLLQLISFKFGNNCFGINIINVRAVINVVKLISVHSLSIYVEGAINLLEDMVPIFNLRAKLKLSPKRRTNNSKIIVLNINGKIFGFIVDEISEILRIPVSAIEQKPDMIEGIDSKFIKATGKFENRLLILLNIDEILAGEVLTT